MGTNIQLKHFLIYDKYGLFINTKIIYLYHIFEKAIFGQVLKKTHVTPR